jgi:hypothetical protein
MDNLSAPLPPHTHTHTGRKGGGGQTFCEVGTNILVYTGGNKYTGIYWWGQIYWYTVRGTGHLQGVGKLWTTSQSGG